MSEYRDEDDFYRLHNLITEHAWPVSTSGLYVYGLYVYGFACKYIWSLCLWSL